MPFFIILRCFELFFKICYEKYILLINPKMLPPHAHINDQITKYIGRGQSGLDSMQYFDYKSNAPNAATASNPCFSHIHNGAFTHYVERGRKGSQNA